MRRFPALLPIFLVLTACGGGAPAGGGATTGTDQMPSSTNQTTSQPAGY